MIKKLRWHTPQTKIFRGIRWCNSFFDLGPSFGCKNRFIQGYLIKYLDLAKKKFFEKSFFLIFLLSKSLHKCTLLCQKKNNKEKKHGKFLYHIPPPIPEAEWGQRQDLEKKMFFEKKNNSNFFRFQSPYIIAHFYVKIKIKKGKKNTEKFCYHPLPTLGAGYGTQRQDLEKKFREKIFFDFFAFTVPT